MSDERRRVLDLLAQGKITVDEAEQLLQAMGGKPGAQPAAPAADDGAKRKPQFLRIAVHKQGNEQREKDVTIRVPISIVRAGMRLGAIIPRFVGGRMEARLRDRGIDVDLGKIDPAMIESLLNDLGEVNIDVDSGKAWVRITCE